MRLVPRKRRKDAQLFRLGKQMVPKMIDQERVKELFDYRDGNLLWRVTTSNRVKVGDVAGSLNSDGYMQTRVDGKKYYNHRLVFLYHHGYMPEHFIDHIDQEKSNNHIENLREVGRTCNARNAGNPANNTSGIRGVTWANKSGKWMAQVKINGKNINLGFTTCLLEAACLRLAAEQAEGWAGCDSSSPAFQYIKQHIKHPRGR